MFYYRMPYYGSRGNYRYGSKSRSYKRTSYNRKPRVNRNVKAYMNTRLKAVERHDHPINYIDVQYTNVALGTTGFLLSVGQQIENAVETRNLQGAWPITGYGTDSFKTGKISCVGVSYQFQYRQNSAGLGPSTILTNTVRALCYKFGENYGSYPLPIMNQGVNGPPFTIEVKKMYFDKLYTLKSAITESATDDSEFVPGQATQKGYVKLNEPFEYVATADADNSSVDQVSNTDIRFEHIVDLGAGTEIGNTYVYASGYVRIYFRLHG